MIFQRLKYSLGIILAILLFLIPFNYYLGKELLQSPAIFARKDDLNTAQGKIFDGMYANYTLDFWGNVNNSQFKYSQVSGNLYNVTWDNIFATSSWIENKLTRIVSNASGDFSTRNGRHTFLWLFTNISLGNLTLIAIDGSDNHMFNVSDEIRCIYEGIGEIDVWVLQDLYEPSGVAWYEKNTGILINGTFIWRYDYFSLTLTSTNIFEYYQYQDYVLEIPGYKIIMALSIIIVVLLVAIKKIRKKISDD